MVMILKPNKLDYPKSYVAIMILRCRICPFSYILILKYTVYTVRRNTFSVLIKKMINLEVDCAVGLYISLQQFDLPNPLLEK